MIIGVKFVRSDDSYAPRVYNYFCDLDLSVGELIDVPVRDTFTRAVVVAVDIPEDEVVNILPFMKTVTTIVKPPVFTAMEDEPNE